MIIGTCSECGGRVSTPDVWHGVIPPIPQCESCGATAADHGPVIKMRRPATGNGQLVGVEWKPTTTEYGRKP